MTDTETPKVAAHTPGPWRVPVGYSDFQIHDWRGKRVADVLTLELRAAECEANARLIAAAPDLLAVVREALLLMRPGTNLHKRTIAAIRKAEGRAP